MLWLWILGGIVVVYLLGFLVVLVLCIRDHAIPVAAVFWPVIYTRWLGYRLWQWVRGTIERAGERRRCKGIHRSCARSASVSAGTYQSGNTQIHKAAMKAETQSITIQLRRHEGLALQGQILKLLSDPMRLYSPEFHESPLGDLMELLLGNFQQSTAGVNFAKHRS
jgi:hypothetical protein